MEDYRVRYQQWLDDPFIDEETKAELRGITDENEIKERFFKELDSGQAVCAALSATAATD